MAVLIHDIHQWFMKNLYIQTNSLSGVFYSEILIYFEKAVGTTVTLSGIRCYRMTSEFALLKINNIDLDIRQHYTASVFKLNN